MNHSNSQIGQKKVKTIISKFKFAHQQSKHISFLKIHLLLCILCLIKQEYFFVHLVVHK